MSDRYGAILAELVARRDVLTVELNGVNSAIAAIMPLVAGETPPPKPWVIQTPGKASDHPPATAVAQGSTSQQFGDYSRISVRWAALWHLAEYARGPLRNAEIADAILSGGYHSGAGSFPNAVSAVLSGMRSKGELDGSPETGYYLTDQGREIWRSIKRSERFRSAIAASSNDAPLLSVQ